MLVHPLGNPKYPNQQIRWPAREGLQTQIQQFKGASQPSALTTNGVSQVASANQPKAVLGLRTTVGQSGSLRRVTVSFTRAVDPFFQKVNVYLKQGSSPPILVTSSPSSPITFMTNRSTAASTIFAQTEGNWGPMPLQQSPSISLHLG
jgi:hypothetical protein